MRIGAAAETQIARNQSRDFPWINRLENGGEHPQCDEKENNGVKGKERKWLSKSSEGKNISLCFHFPSESHVGLEW